MGVLWFLLGAGLLVLLDWLLLRFEARGWINYRRRGLSRSGAAFHGLTLHSMFNPGATHLQAIIYEQVDEEDDSGDPPPGDVSRERPGDSSDGDSP